MRSRELVLVTKEEIAATMGKQGVTNPRRIFIRKAEEQKLTDI